MTLPENSSLAAKADRDGTEPLIFAWILDGQGGLCGLTWPDVQHWRPAAPGEVLWLHFDRSVHSVPAWLRDATNAA